MADDFRDVLLELERLESGDKHIRKRALENICSALNATHGDLPENKRKVLVSVVIRPVLGALTDPTERCRELAAQLLLDIASVLPLSDDIVALIVPALKRRLLIAGSEPVATAAAVKGEVAEEVRLLEAQALTRTVMSAGARCASHLNDVVITLCACLEDPFVEVKKEGCRCVVQLEKAVPNHFHLQCDSMLPALVQALRHQHSALRTLAVQALGPILEQNDCSSLTPTVISSVAELLDDRSPAVRMALATAAARWVAKTFSSVALPIVLIALSDPVESVRAKASDLWSAVGKLYATDQSMRPAVEGEGCRLLVQKHLSYLVGVAHDSLQGWRLEEQLRAAKLLCEAFRYAGPHAASHVCALLPTLTTVLCRDEQDLRHWLTQGLETCARWVDPESWLDAVSVPFSTGALHALAALVRPCPPDRLRPYAQQLFPVLFEYSGAAADTRSQLEVLGIMDALLSSVSDPMDLSVKELLSCCLSIRASSSRDECVAEKVSLLLRQLADMLSLPCVEDLCLGYGKDLIQDLCEKNRPHTKAAAQWDALRELVTLAGAQSGDLVPSLVALLNAVQRRPEWQPQAATVLHQALSEGRKMPPQCTGATLQALLPLLTAAGRPCVPTRTAGLRCLLQLIECIPSLQVSGEVVTAVLSLLEDRQPQVRVLACRAVAGCVPEQLAVRGLAQRLEDDSRQVRVAAARALENLALDGLEAALDALALHATTSANGGDEEDAAAGGRNSAASNCPEAFSHFSDTSSQLELEDGVLG
ncbi:dynein axonemal assembly factor 5-like [Haemaphysalis longicornis]